MMLILLLEHITYLFKCILDSSIQNKKIHHWTTNLRSYSCRIEYIEGKKNVCADMLSHLPHPTDSLDNSGDSDPDITDRTFEINLINSSDFNAKGLQNMVTSMKINNVIKRN